MQERVICNILFLGDSFVGKTSIINTFVSNIFNEYQEITIGVSLYIKNIENNKKKYNIRIWDTNGNKNYKSLFIPYYKIAEAVVIVYDLTNIESLKNAEKLIDSVKNINNKCPIFVVGNKCDIKNITENDIKNKVNIDIKHQIISAKNIKNIKKLFDNIINSIKIE
tara:strand:- start:246 stop:743 length:498 start_codon:yes stop_codon:yes gene_type:complete